MSIECKSCAIVIDDQSLDWLIELTVRLSALGKIAPRSVELIELIDRIPNRTTAFNCKTLPTGRTNEYRIVFEPSNALRDLMGAMRARESMGEHIGKSFTTRRSCLD